MEFVGGDAAVSRASHRGLELDGPPVVHPHHVLGAGLGPADRLCQFSGQHGNHDVLGIPSALGPEPASHIRGYDPHQRCVDAKRSGQPVPCPVGELGRRPLGEPEGAVMGRVGVPAGHGRTRFDGSGGQAVVAEGQVDPNLDLGEDVVLPVRRDRHDRVGAGLREQDDLVAHRLAHVDHDVERFVVDHHRLGGVHTGLTAGGHHHGHRLSHVANPVGGQPCSGHRLVEDRHRRLLGRQIEIGGGEHPQHTGHRRCVGGVDTADIGVGHDRADKGGMNCVGRSQIVDIGSTDRQQFRILSTNDAGSDHAHDGCSLDVDRVWGFRSLSVADVRRQRRPAGLNRRSCG